MRGVAAAYQSKDVAFFREHWAQFNEQMANAIRTSPSVRVDFDVKRIDVRDDHHATVHVRRTDTFPQAAMPLGGAESRVSATTQPGRSLRSRGSREALLGRAIIISSEQRSGRLTISSARSPYRPNCTPAVTTLLARIPTLLIGTMKLKMNARLSAIFHLPPITPSMSERPTSTSPSSTVLWNSEEALGRMMPRSSPEIVSFGLEAISVPSR